MQKRGLAWGRGPKTDAIMAPLAAFEARQQRQCRRAPPLLNVFLRVRCDHEPWRFFCVDPG